MRSVGVSYPAINASDLGDIPVHLPPPKSQRAIANHLDRETTRLDALVAAKERVLELLAEKRRALITRAVTRGLDPSAPLRGSGVPWLGEIPEHWRVERLKFHLHGIEQGWSPICDKMPATLEEWGVLKAGCVNGWDFDSNENKRLPEAIRSRTQELADLIIQIWPVPQNHRSGFSPDRPRLRKKVHLSDLIRGGALEPGLSLFPRRKKFSARVATLLPDGRVEVDGVAFSSPSEAATSITGHPTNGWWFFLVDQASRRSLRTVRRDYVNAMAVDVEDDEAEEDGDEDEG